MINYIKKKIKGHFIQNYSMPDLRQFLLRIKELGFNPNTVFDVGAYEGDFALLIKSIWPSAEIYCFEGLADKVTLLNQLSKKDNNIHVVEGLVGEEDNDHISFYQAETSSSILAEHYEKNAQVVNLKMHRLETLIDRKIVPVPNFLKIDTQGYEYPVLKGMGDYIQEVDLILAELNFIDIYKNVTLAVEVITYLHQQGFVPFDITEIHRRPLDKSVNQVDFVFVREDSFLRTDKRWKK